MLRNLPVWDVNRVNAEINGGTTDRVTLAMPVPVLILYATAVAGDATAGDGTMYFFKDVYGYDADFQRALAGGYPHLHEASPAGEKSEAAQEKSRRES